MKSSYNRTVPIYFAVYVFFIARKINTLVFIAPEILLFVYVLTNGVDFRAPQIIHFK